VLAALVIPALSLGVFWLVVYDSGPLVALAVILEALVVLALAFAYAARQSSRAAVVEDDEGGR
jgi:hypothetical protein